MGAVKCTESLEPHSRMAVGQEEVPGAPSTWAWTDHETKVRAERKDTAGLCAPHSSFPWSPPRFLAEAEIPAGRPLDRKFHSWDSDCCAFSLSFLNGASAQQETYENTSHQVHTLRRLIKEKEEAFQRRCHLEPNARDLESVGSEALARVGSAELSVGMPSSDLDLLPPALPPEETLPLPPPPAPPLPPPPPPLPGKEDPGS